MFSFEEHKDDLILVGGCRPQKRIIPPTDEREKSGKTTLENTQMLILIAKIQIYLYISNIFCNFAPDFVKW